MDAVTKLGKYFFAIPFAIFGVMHLMNADAMAPMAFGSSILVYITGVCLIAAAVSMLIGKMAKLAAMLLALFLIATVLAVHLQAVMGGDEMAMGQILKDVALAGAALMYADAVGDGGSSGDRGGSQH